MIDVGHYSFIKTTHHEIRRSHGDRLMSEGDQHNTTSTLQK